MNQMNHLRFLSASDMRTSWFLFLLLVILSSLATVDGFLSSGKFQIKGLTSFF